MTERQNFHLVVITEFVLLTDWENEIVADPWDTPSSSLVA